MLQCYHSTQATAGVMSHICHNQLLIIQPLGKIKPIVTGYFIKRDRYEEMFDLLKVLSLDFLNFNTKFMI